MAVEQELVDIKTQLAQLVQVSQQQATNIARLAETSEQQRLTIERLTGAFTEQARAIASLSQTVSRLIDAAQRAAQASTGGGCRGPK